MWWNRTLRIFGSMCCRLYVLFCWLPSFWLECSTLVCCLGRMLEQKFFSCCFCYCGKVGQQVSVC